MPTQGYKHLFGPVQSRRLGYSLGVDLIPFKTCPLDCVYCECGTTTDLTVTRSLYVPTAVVCAEIDDYVAKHPDLDVITFSGAGEPTLALNIGEVIRHIKQKHPQYKVCVLTNAVLFAEAQVRQEIAQADIVIPSLDAVSEMAFEKVDRPHPDLQIQKIIEALIVFRQEFKGQLFVEIFFVPGLNDTAEELQEFVKVLHKIKPDGVQINSLDRKGTEAWVEPVSQESLDRIVTAFKDFSVQIYGKRQPTLRTATRIEQRHAAQE